MTEDYRSHLIAAEIIGNSRFRVIEFQYLLLEKRGKERQPAYRALFRGRMPERDVTAIREATNKAWALGNDRFRRQIEAKTGRRLVPSGRGGDRKSEKYRKVKINDTDPIDLDCTILR